MWSSSLAARTAKARWAQDRAAFPFVDAAVSGEGELVLPDGRARADRRRARGLQGVRTQASIALSSPTRLLNGPTVRHMDDLPRPDYTDYAPVQASRLDREWMPTLYSETSRGCWWGERQHCTFCG
jgi:magnesium-protoporphyrin IX monomethyl ester (oxidative) cyclase